MENRDKILIAILVISICALTCAIFISLSNSISYERIELVPNGTSIEIPTSQAKYLGEEYGIKMWNWSDGVLISFNIILAIFIFKMYLFLLIVRKEIMLMN